MKEKRGEGKGAIRQQNQSRILRAAEQEFVKNGYKGTSIQAIADRVELPKANILYYFKSKSGLYKALLSDILTMWNQGFAEDAVNQDPAKVIEQYIVEKMRYSRTHPIASKIFAMEIIQGAPVIQEDLQLQVVDWTKGKSSVIQSWIEQGKLSQVEPLYLLYLIWGSTQFYADFEAEVALINGRAMTEQEFNQAEAFTVETILRGLKLID